jgi:hypothetical protein
VDERCVATFGTKRARDGTKRNEWGRNARRRDGRDDAARARRRGDATRHPGSHRGMSSSGVVHHPRGSHPREERVHPARPTARPRNGRAARRSFPSRAEKKSVSEVPTDKSHHSTRRRDGRHARGGADDGASSSRVRRGVRLRSDRGRRLRAAEGEGASSRGGRRRRRRRRPRRPRGGARRRLARLQVRSIHWSPYDRVRVVNADP